MDLAPSVGQPNPGSLVFKSLSVLYCFSDMSINLVLVLMLADSWTDYNNLVRYGRAKDYNYLEDYTQRLQFSLSMENYSFTSETSRLGEMAEDWGQILGQRLENGNPGNGHRSNFWWFLFETCLFSSTIVADFFAILWICLKVNRRHTLKQPAWYLVFTGVQIFAYYFLLQFCSNPDYSAEARNNNSCVILTVVLILRGIVVWFCIDDGTLANRTSLSSEV